MTEGVSGFRVDTDLRATETRSGLVLARGGRVARSCSRHFELRVLVVRLVRYEHPDLAPAVEEHYYRSYPNHEDQHDDCDFNPAHLNMMCIIFIITWTHRRF